MNCPQCEQPVAPDATHTGPWQPVQNERGIAENELRTVLIACPHCGNFDATQDASNKIIDIVGPLSDPASDERFTRLVPASRREIRIPA